MQNLTASGIEAPHEGQFRPATTAGGGAVAGGCGASCNTGFPHWMQNLTASGIEAPHEGHIRPATVAGGGAVTASGLPQDVQNFSPGLL